VEEAAAKIAPILKGIIPYLLDHVVLSFAKSTQIFAQ